MNDPKISIVTITYNSERTLEETIKSIIDSKYDNLEYIIIDGGSTDSTLTIVEKYKKYISLVISEPDDGISDAFNKGINKATGDIIGIINSDDLLLPGALRALADNYSIDIDVYRGNTMIWNAETNDYFRAVPTMKFPLYQLTRNICHQSTFVLRSAYMRWGMYNTKYKYMMDVDLLTRFYQKGAAMMYIKEDMAVSRLGGITDSTILKKTGEIEAVVMDNNGNYILAKIKRLFFVISQIIKKISFIIVPKKYVRKIKYRLLGLF